MAFAFGAVCIICVAISFSFFLSSTHKAKEPAVRSDLIVPTDEVFLQRSDLISQIDEKFSGRPGIQSLAIIGPGGAGKTTIARQYAHQQHAPMVWEINAETRENLNTSFESLGAALSNTAEDKKELAKIQDIKEDQKRGERLIQFVKNHLRQLPHWFLIFDNVERFADIKNYFPQDTRTWGEGRILLTTQDKNVESNSQINYAIMVEELNSEQKLDLFTKILNHGVSQPFTPQQQEETRKFLENIPSFPLDVSTAAHYIKATHISYDKYLENLKNYHPDFKNVQQNLLKEVGPYAKTRYEIITLSLDQLLKSHKDFGGLLLLISLLDSQKIPRDILRAYKGDEILDNFMYHLKKYSLIANDPSATNPTFSIHRSIQTIMLAHLKEVMELRENQSPTKVIVNLLEQDLAEAIEQDNITKMSSLYNHISVFLNHNDMLSKEDAARIQSTKGYLESYLLKNNIKAKQDIEKSYLIAKEGYPDTDLKLGKFLVYLGIVCRKLGEYENARGYLEKALKIYKAHFSEKHTSVGWVLENLGSVYRNLAEPDKAKEILKQALENYKTNISKNRAQYARSITTLGIIYNDLGNYKKATDLLNQSLHIQKTYFPENYPEIIWILGFLGESYRFLKEYAKAKDFLEQGVSLQKKHFSDSSTEYSWFLFLLGKLYRDCGDYAQAKKYLKTSLAYYEKTYGKDHTDTAVVMRSLGQTYELEGDLKLAEIFFRDALKIFQKNESPDQYMVLENLAQINLKKSIKEKLNGNNELAEVLKNNANHNLQNALEIVKVHFPSNSPHKERIEYMIKTIKQQNYITP